MVCALILTIVSVRTTSYLIDNQTHSFLSLMNFTSYFFAHLRLKRKPQKDGASQFHVYFFRPTKVIKSFKSKHLAPPPKKKKKKKKLSHKTFKTKGSRFLKLKVLRMSSTNVWSPRFRQLGREKPKIYCYTLQRKPNSYKAQQISLKEQKVGKKSY